MKSAIPKESAAKETLIPPQLGLSCLAQTALAILIPSSVGGAHVSTNGLYAVYTMPTRAKIVIQMPAIKEILFIPLVYQTKRPL